VLPVVLRNARVADGLARGLRESVKALDRKEAHLCILASSCDNKEYKTLVTALCREQSIYIIEVQKGKDLGEWVGLCKRRDEEGKPVKVVSCSCCVVKNYGVTSSELEWLQNFLKESGKL